MLHGVDARSMGKKGGRSRSAAKVAASRRNGRRGGRPRKADVFARKLQRVCAEIGPQLPEIDPGDLRLIVRTLLLPAAQRAVFVTRRKDGRYGF
jgi:hypothetical protein